MLFQLGAIAALRCKTPHTHTPLDLAAGDVPALFTQLLTCLNAVRHRLLKTDLTAFQGDGDAL